MTDRKQSRGTGLLAGCAALATVLGGEAAVIARPPASASSDTYFLRYNREVDDGQAIVSISHDTLVGRARNGDQSIMLHDFQAGAVTVERGGRTELRPFLSRRGIDAGFSYDYRDRRLSGSGEVARIFNTYLRDLGRGSPPLGSDARWTVPTDLAALGLPGPAAAPLSLNLSRTYLENQGQRIVLIEFEVPAFQYRDPEGETIIHWVRGFAVTDADFAEVHAMGSQHRAAVMGPDGLARPIAIRTSRHAIDRAGNWRMTFADAPAVAAAVKRTLATAGDRAATAIGGSAGDDTPYAAIVAQRLDLAAFAVGENGGNPLPAVAGTEPEIETPNADLVQRINEASERVRRLEQELERLEQEREPIIAARQTIDDLFGRAEALQRELAQTSDPARAEQLEGQIRQTFTDLSDMMSQMAAIQSAQSELTQAVIRGGGSTDAEMDALLSQLAAGDVPLGDIGPRLAAALEELRQSAEPPPWFTPEPRQGLTPEQEAEIQYRLLLAEMERELEETRREERRREQREESGIDSLDEFVKNNAFTYTSLVGTVETDLSRWAEWLATQDIRELERLALLIGYPNLPSALADAESLIRFAEDDGYRRWSNQAPSCGGLSGCGPSYLERWWMRQATVALGDILADSREIFSSGGFSDIGISGLNLAYLLRDNALEDGDIVQIRISQFGRTLFQGQVNLTNLGESFSQILGRGLASLEIFAVNEGSAPPNTAQIVIDNVVRGNGTQSYSLRTGETATLRIESNAEGN